jgi:Flp pilus assembly protein TadG
VSGRDAEAGSASVEFALVLPLVLLLALALLQTGLLMTDRLLLAGAARAGAREAAVGGDEERVRGAAVAAGGLDPDRLSVDVVRAGAEGGEVSVTVHYRSRIAVPLVGWLFPEGVDLSDRVSMRQEVDATAG